MNISTKNDFMQIGTFNEVDKLRILSTAKRKKAKYIIIVCDTFDYDDYPVYVKDAKNLNKEIDNYHGKNMQRVMGVYSLEDNDGQR